MQSIAGSGHAMHCWQVAALLGGGVSFEYISITLSAGRDERISRECNPLAEIVSSSVAKRKFSLRSVLLVTQTASSRAQNCFMRR